MPWVLKFTFLPARSLQALNLRPNEDMQFEGEEIEQVGEACSSISSLLSAKFSFCHRRRSGRVLECQTNILSLTQRVGSILCVLNAAGMSLRV